MTKSKAKRTRRYVHDASCECCEYGHRLYNANHLCEVTYAIYPIYPLAHRLGQSYCGVQVVQSQ